MQLIRLVLKNIKKHKELVIDFSSKKGLLILGKNGQGKSTILESIYYALFRSTLVPNTKYLISDFIKYEKNGKEYYKAESKIELTFSASGKIYKVEHELTKNKCTIKEKTENSWKLISNKARDVLYFIQKTININEQVFINILYTAQMDLLKMFDTRDSERYEIYNKLFQLEKFKKIRTAIQNFYKKYDYKNIESKLESIELRKSDIESFIETLNKDLESYTYSTPEDLEEEINNVSEIINQKMNKQENLKIEIKNQLEIYNKATEIHRQINDAIESINNLNLVSKVESIKEELLEKKNKVLYLEQQIQKIYDYLPGFLFLKYNITKKKSELENDLEILRKNIEYINQLEFIIHNHKKQIEEEKLRIEDIVNEIKNITTLKKEDIRKYHNEINEIKRKQEEIQIKLYQYKNYIIQNINLLYPENYKLVKKIVTNIPQRNNNIDTNQICPLCRQKIDENHLKIINDECMTYLYEYQKFMSSLQEANEEIKNIENILSEEDSKHNELSKLYNRLEIERNALKKMEEDLMNYQKQLDNYPEKETLIQQYNELERTITQNYNVQIINNLENQLKNYFDLSTIQPENKEINLAELSELISMYAKYLMEKDSYQSLLREYESNNELLNNYNNIIDSNTKLMKTFISNVNNRYDLYNFLIEKHKDILSKQSELEFLSKEIIDLNYSLRSLKEIKPKLLNIIKNKNSAIEKLKNIEEEINKLNLERQKREILDELKEIFSNNKLPLFLKKEYIKIINQKLPELFSLFNFPFIPEIDFESLNFKDYHKYSGGQKIVSALSVKFILTELFSKSKSKQIMLLDEPTAYLDQERILYLKEFLEKINNKVQLVIITHDLELKDIKNMELFELE